MKKLSTYNQWVESVIHEAVGQGEAVARQVDLVLQVKVEVL